MKSVYRPRSQESPFPNVTRSTNLLDLIRSDTYDFKSFMTRSGMKYFIIFFGNHCRFCHVHLVKSKDEVFCKFIEFRTRVKKKIGHPVKKLRSDKGGEYRLKGAKHISGSMASLHRQLLFTPHSPMEFQKGRAAHSLRW